jgi:TonB family protein
MRLAKVACVLLGVIATAAGSDMRTVVRAAAPGYPQLPSGGRLEGEIPVEVELAAEGGVLKAVARGGTPLLRMAAEAAARDWRFEPSTREGEKALIVFAFVLREGLSEPPAVVSAFIAPNRLEIYAKKREIVRTPEPADEDVVRSRKRQKQ